MFTGTLEEIVKECASDTIEPEVFDLSEICRQNGIIMALECCELIGDTEPDIPTVELQLDLSWNLTHAEMWDIADTSEFTEALEKAFETLIQEGEKPLGISVTLEILDSTERDMDAYQPGNYAISLSFVPDESGRWNGWQTWDSEKTSDAMWDILATFINVTDPGTFGSPYIMDKVRENLSCG